MMSVVHRNIFRTTIWMSFALGISHPQPSSHTSPEKLLVVSQGDATMTLIDVGSGKSAKLQEGAGAIVAHEVATSADGRTAYLPLYGSSGIGKPGLDGHTMLRVDVPSGKITGTLEFGHPVRPHCVVFSPNGKLLYVTTELDRTISIVDPVTFRIVGSVSTDQEQSHMFAISHNGKRGYTANVGPGTLSVLDLTTRRPLKIIPVSGNVQRVSVSNDDSMVFTADQTTPRLAVIDTVRNEIKNWIDLPSVGYGTAPTLDGKYLLVTLNSASQLASVDLRTLKVTRTLAVCEHPQEVLAAPDGTTAYVSCIGGHQVASVNLTDWRVERLIDVGERADGMAWAKTSR